MIIRDCGKIYEIIKQTAKSEIKNSLQTSPAETKCKELLSRLFYTPDMKPKSVYDNCKTKCVQALKGWNPFEKTFVLDAETGNIIKELNGNLHGCYIDERFLRENPVKILHGHTVSRYGVTPPVSFQDFKLLTDNKNITEITAVDKLGRESSLRKTENYKHISNSSFKKIKAKYINCLMENADRADREKILELRQYCDTHKNSTAVECQISEYLTELQYKKSGVEALDKFWENYAGELGLEYKPFQ